MRKLNDAGHRDVTAARLAPHEIPANGAAGRLSQALIGPPGIQGVLAGQAITGRVYLTAAHTGLFRAGRSRIDALNALQEDITLATLQDHPLRRAGPHARRGGSAVQGCAPSTNDCAPPENPQSSPSSPPCASSCTPPTASPKTDAPSRSERSRRGRRSPNITQPTAPAAPMKTACST